MFIILAAQTLMILGLMVGLFLQNQPNGREGQVVNNLNLAYPTSSSNGAGFTGTFSEASISNDTGCGVVETPPPEPSCEEGEPDTNTTDSGTSPPPPCECTNGTPTTNTTAPTNGTTDTNTTAPVAVYTPVSFVRAGGEIYGYSEFGDIIKELNYTWDAASAVPGDKTIFEFIYGGPDGRGVKMNFDDGITSFSVPLAPVTNATWCYYTVKGELLVPHSINYRILLHLTVTATPSSGDAPSVTLTRFYGRYDNQVPTSVWFEAFGPGWGGEGGTGSSGDFSYIDFYRITEERVPTV